MESQKKNKKPIPEIIHKYVTYDELLIMMQDGNKVITIKDNRFPALLEIKMDRASYLRPKCKHYLVTAEQMSTMKKNIELAAEADVEYQKLRYRIEDGQLKKHCRLWQSKYQNLKLMYDELQKSTVTKHKYEKLLKAFNELKSKQEGT